MAATLTPLAAAWIMTVSPIWSLPTSTRPCQAVDQMVGTVAASS
jgi:hypothetical protein